jgi:hypothetical protein
VGKFEDGVVWSRSDLQIAIHAGPICVFTVAEANRDLEIAPTK